MTTQPLHHIPDPREQPTMRIEDAGRFLGIGRSSSYNAVKAGEFPIPVIKVGKRYIVPTAALLRLLELGGGGADATPA